MRSVLGRGYVEDVSPPPDMIFRSKTNASVHRLISALVMELRPYAGKQSGTRRGLTRVRFPYDVVPRGVSLSRPAQPCQPWPRASRIQETFQYLLDGRLQIATHDLPLLFPGLPRYATHDGSALLVLECLSDLNPLPLPPLDFLISFSSSYRNRPASFPC